MTEHEIEKCVCGSEADFLDPHLECPACGRAGWNVERWNHDMRGLRLLRELGNELFHSLSFQAYDEDKQSKDAAHELALRIDAWAKEGER